MEYFCVIGYYCVHKRAGDASFRPARERPTHSSLRHIWYYGTWHVVVRPPKGTARATDYSTCTSTSARGTFCHLYPTFCASAPSIRGETRPRYILSFLYPRVRQPPSFSPQAIAQPFLLGLHNKHPPHPPPTLSPSPSSPAHQAPIHIHSTETSQQTSLDTAHCRDRTRATVA
jgi:hypothetical protein